MSRLYGTLSGAGKRVTKTGNVILGATVNGWSAGIGCTGTVNLENGKPTDGERFSAQVTGGSNGEPCTNAVMYLHDDGTVDFYHNGILVYTTKGK